MKKDHCWCGEVFPQEKVKPEPVAKPVRERRKLRRKGGRSAAEALWAKNVKNRDKACLDCGSAENLIAHHIKPRKDYPELSLAPENGVTLCQPCHRSRHPELPDSLFRLAS